PPQGGWLHEGQQLVVERQEDELVGLGGQGEQVDDAVRVLDQAIAGQCEVGRLAPLALQRIEIGNLPRRLGSRLATRSADRAHENLALTIAVRQSYCPPPCIGARTPCHRVTGRTDYRRSSVPRRGRTVARRAGR